MIVFTILLVIKLIITIAVYLKHRSLPGDGKGERNYAYFILDGVCQMVQTLRIATTRTRKQKCYRLVSEEEEPKPCETIAMHFMQVCLMDKGECFAIGKLGASLLNTSLHILFTWFMWLYLNTEYKRKLLLGAIS